MALPPLQQQTPGGTNPPPEDSAKEEAQTEESAVRYFVCSWPDFRVAKPERPLIQFTGRFLQTQDQALADWILEITEKSNFPCDVKEITKEEYMDGQFEAQLTSSED